MKKIIKYPSGSTTFHFDTSLLDLQNLIDIKHSFIITDENIYRAHKKTLSNFQLVVIPAGEEHKHIETVTSIIKQLIEKGADRKTFLVGVGGGVVTDITGFVASIYMRGIDFGFVPTSILAMVDASIGGKNGVDVGIFKNMVGNFKQPSFLLYDYSLLKSLPTIQWQNGFAEIIKHAAIKDLQLFEILEQHQLSDFQNDNSLLGNLIMRNALLKAEVVQQDEFEKGDRKLLNFGHTLGHSIENQYQLLHGHAVSIGMVVAAYLSKSILDFSGSERLVKLIQQYGLPAFMSYDSDLALKNMLSDKKRVKNVINYVLLEKLGHAIYKPLRIEDISPIVERLSTNN